LPEKDNPQWKLSTEFILDNYELDEDTILIGHSSGATLILSLLDAIDESIEKAILVAGYTAPLPDIERTAYMIQPSYNTDKMKNNAEEIIFINSDNDPYGCDDAQARSLARELGAIFVFAE
jgi:predicted alpha/beta hydrolase family esterase